jgi:two-component system response regulator LytT
MIQHEKIHLPLHKGLHRHKIMVMKSIKILIVENLKSIEISLKTRLVDMGFEVIDQVSTPQKALEVLEQKRIDIVVSDLFLDRELSGVVLAERCHEQYNTPVLFLSSENTLKNQAALNHLNFAFLVQKPAGDLELKVNIESSVKIYAELRQNRGSGSNQNIDQYIYVRADFRLNRIRLKDIYYIEAKKDYVTINTGDNVFTVHTTMRDIMHALPERHFIRIHRSYIVNMDRIFSIKYPDLLVENKMKTLPIGGLYRKELFDRLNVI